jgi:hypothetical protein
VWLALSVFVGRRLPRWLGIRNPAGKWAVTVAAVAVLLIGPFVDHIVGMWQFQKLCDEQTGLQVYPNAAKTTRARQDSTGFERLEGNAITIRRSVSTIIDMDTGEVIARYNYFTTPGGVIGRAPMIGGEYACSVKNSMNPDHRRFLALKEQVKLTYGEMK